MLLFADDVALFAHSVEALQRIFAPFDQFCMENALVINKDKTVVMLCGKKKLVY